MSDYNVNLSLLRYERCTMSESTHLLDWIIKLFILKIMFIYWYISNNMYSLVNHRLLNIYGIMVKCSK